MTSSIDNARTVARALLLSAALGVGAGHAAAQETPPDPATEAYTQGATFASEGRWEEARAKFEEAVAIRATPVSLFNLAQAERNLGRLKAAKQHFIAARKLADREAAGDVARLVDDALAEVNPRVPRLVLRLPADAARVAVRIDGQPAEIVEDEVELDPGKHVVEVSAAGEQPYVRELVLVEGQRASMDVRFPRPAAPPLQTDASSTKETPDTSTTRSGPPAGAIVLGGVGVAALVAGTVFHVRRNSKLDQAADGCVRTGDGWRCPTSLENDPDHLALRDAADTAETWRNVLFGVGGAALVGGGLWWALDSGPEQAPAKVAVAINPDPRAASARLRFRF